MNPSSEMTVARRLLIAFGVIIMTFLAVAASVLYSSAKLAEADKWNTHTHKVMAIADNMLKSMINMETGVRGFSIAGDDRFLEPWTNGLQSFEQSWSEAKKLTADNPSQQTRLDAMKSKHIEFVAVANSLIQLRRDVSADKTSMDNFVTEFKLGKDKAAMDSFRGLQDEFYKAESDLLAARSASADALRAFNRNVVIFGALLAMMAAALLGLWVTRAITTKLGGEPAYAANVAREIAQGNLMVEVHTQAGDTTSLMAAMKAMRDSLAAVVTQVRQGSEGVSTASSEIAQGNHDLSARTESQASSLEQTAASMEELGSTVKQNADSARTANELAQSASTVAIQGGEVVAQVVETMRGINDSSKKMADIINVIEGIAFQTNILALNAAVEAARAGEQGRGFAVVASEVRSLAGRSAEAAKEIKGLIGASVERVEQGSALVDRAGSTMSEVVSSIKRVTDLMGEISAASNEQAAGVAQVGEAVAQIDLVTQQNAALVEEMAAAASGLKSQADELVNTVAVFKLGSGGGGHLAHKASPAPHRVPQRAPAALGTARPTAKLANRVAPKVAMKKPTLAPPEAKPADDSWETF